MTSPVERPTGPLQRGAEDPTETAWGTMGYDAIERGTRHNLDGQSFASVERRGWHNVGKVAPVGTPADVLMKMAQADFDVFHTPIMTEFPVPMFAANGEPIFVPGFRDEHGERVQQTQIMTATDPNRRNVCRVAPATGQLQILGQTSARYNIWQHRDMFLNFAEALLGLDQSCVSTCGVLYEGRQVFMCWKLPEDIKIDGYDDTVQLWMLAHTSHDASTPSTLSVTPLRTVCGNTVRWNLRNRITSMSIRHTGGMKVKVEEARAALKISHAYGAEFTDVAKGLLATKMTTPQFEGIVSGLFAPDEDASPAAKTRWDNRLERLLELWATEETQAGSRGTAWAGVNALGEYADWEQGFQSKAWAANPTGGKFWRAVSGDKTVTQPKNRMLAVVREFAGV